MAFDQALADRIEVCLPDGATSRAMFGGLAFLVGGNMACGVIEDRLVVRVGAEAYEAALAEPDVSEMDFTGRPMTGWVYVHEEGLATEEDLAAWVQRGVAYASSLPVK